MKCLQHYLIQTQAKSYIPICSNDSVHLFFVAHISKRIIPLTFFQTVTLLSERKHLLPRAQYLNAIEVEFDNRHKGIFYSLKGVKKTAS